MTEFETPFTHAFNIKVPIVQAPMGSFAVPGLAAAVSNAGGLGMISVWLGPPDRIEATIEETRAQTNRPFGVNLNLAFYDPVQLDAALAARAPVVHFFWGEATSQIKQAKDGGAKVMVTVGSAAEAEKAARAGADAIVPQSYEAGGHVWGEIGAIALIPAVVDAAGGVPVVAAGGIADGRGLAAALMLGASGAWMGTRFLACTEIPVHAGYKKRLIEARETDTVFSRLFDIGWPDAPVRTLRNKTIDTWEEAGRPAPGARPGEGETVVTLADGSAIPRYHAMPPDTGTDGDWEAMALYAGQGVALVHEEMPAERILEETVAEAREALARWQNR